MKFEQDDKEKLEWVLVGILLSLISFILYKIFTMYLILR